MANKMSKEELQIKKVLEQIRTKIYLNNELSETDIVFSKWYIKQFISDNVLNNTDNLKYKRVWNIRTYDAIVKFKSEISSTKLQNLTNKERLISVLKSIFKLQQALSKDKPNEFDYLMEEVSQYYKECFIRNNTEDKILFNSNKIKIIVSFVNNEITLENKKTNKIYTRDIILDELQIFPNKYIASQYIK